MLTFNTPGPEKQASDPSSHQNQNGAPNQSPQPRFTTDTLIWLVMMLLFLYYWTVNKPSSTEIRLPYSEFKSELRDGNVKSVLLHQDTVTGKFNNPITRVREDAQGRSVGLEHVRFRSILPSIEDSDLMPLFEEHGVEVNARTESSPLWLTIVLSMIPWLLIFIFIIYSSRMFRKNMVGGGPFRIGKANVQTIKSEDIEVGFSDVAGLDSAKRDLQEVIDYLKDSEKYVRIGAKLPKGILMMGPPGCGKTLLAKATAGEANVPFFSVSGSEFIEMFVGVGAARVRDMFAQARKSAPALIFIDEIDSIGGLRGTGIGGGHDEREQTLNQILAEMDGFSTDQAVIVLAATNRPDVLDPALLRPGRFDRKLVLELPHRKARQAILEVHTRKKPLADEVDLSKLSADTTGFSGADLANLVNEAALLAVREERTEIAARDFDRALDKIILGDVSGIILSDEEKARIAYHEAGHGLLALLLPESDPLKKITIIPHGRALGATEQIPQQEHHNFTQKYIESRITIMLGGRTAEQLIFNEVSSGAENDIKLATDLARKMVGEWGMSSVIGPVNLRQSDSHPFLGRELATHRNFSEHAAKRVDEEVTLLIKQCEAKAHDQLRKHQDALERLARKLLEKETLESGEISELLTPLT